MRGWQISTVLGALVLVLGACTTDDGATDVVPTDAAPETVTVTLAEMSDSGITGTATLTATDGMTQVEVTLDNAGAGPQPIHVHPGTCENLDPAPQYPLSNVESGTSSTTIDATVSSLVDGEFAINVHKSPEEAQVYVACGDIT